MHYVLLIKASNATGASFQQIKQHLKTSFSSVEYMRGFLDGYLFDNYKLLTLQQFEERALLHSNPTENKHFLFLEVVENMED